MGSILKWISLILFTYFILLKFCKKLLHHSTLDRVVCVRCNIAERLKHEHAVVHVDMWNTESFCMHNQVIIQKNIYIKCPWPPVDFAGTLVHGFNSVKEIQQLIRFENCIDSGTAVQKALLLYSAVWLSFIYR